MFTSAKNSYAVTSKTSSLVGNDFVSVMGNDGTIGGKKVDFTGQTYMGHNGPQPFTSGATFYGSFHGQATEAMFSRFAWKAEKAKFAEDADVARAAAAGANFGSTYVAAPAHSNKGGAPETVHDQEIHGPDGPPPIPTLIGAYTSMGQFAIRTVVVDHDDIAKNAREKVDDYQGIFTKTPTTQEVRSAFKNEDNVNLIGGKLVADGIINSDFRRKTPPAIGRTSSSKPTPRFGFTPIGNSTENRGKRFTPKESRR